MPFVSVVVSHVNSVRTIEKCLKHLVSLDYPKDKFEVIVVDGGSTDGSIAIVEKHLAPTLRQLVVPGCAEAEGQSLGVAKSRGEVIMFTNSDIYVPIDWAKRHVNWLEEGYDLVGGAVFWGGDKYSFTWNQPLPKSPYFHVAPGLGPGFSNCSVRKDFLLRVGGLKDLSSQHDAEFALRSLVIGAHLVLDPETEVYHDHPFKSFYRNFRRSYGYAINHITVLKAMFGKVVAGSGTPIYLSPGLVFREVSGIGGLRTYEELRTRARKWNIAVNVGPIEFLFLRLFSTRLGQLIGVLAGALRQHVTFSSVKELHTSRTLLGNGKTERANYTVQ